MTTLTRLSLVPVLAALLSLAPAAPAQVLDPAVQGRNATLRGWLAQAAGKAAPGVVQVWLDGREAGYGALLEGGWVLTADTVTESGGTYEVRGPAGRFAAVRAGRDGTQGVALLRLEATRAPAGLALGRSADLIVGQMVACAGIDGQPLAAGVISATGRRVERSEEAMAQNFLLALFSDGSNQGHLRDFPAVVQHDGPLLPEQLGCPLIDTQGRLVGINVATPWRGSTHAIPIDAVRAILPALQQAAPPPPVTRRPETQRPETQRPARPEAPQAPRGGAWLGVVGIDAPAGQVPGIYSYGVLVQDAQGPAAEAGIRAGDVLVLADGNGFADLDAFAGYFGSKKPGDKVEVGLVRENKLVKVQVTLGGR